MAGIRSQADFGECVLAGRHADGQVANADQAQASAKSRAIDAADQRLGERIEIGEQLRQTPGVSNSLVARPHGLLLHSFKISPCAEDLAIAAEDDHANVAVIPQSTGDARQFIDHLLRHRIAGVRSVQCQPGDSVVRHGQFDCFVRAHQVVSSRNRAAGLLPEMTNTMPGAGHNLMVAHPLANSGA